MKLDMDIVRSLMLQIEKETTLDESLTFEKSQTNPNSFYALLKLKEAGYINSIEINTWIGVVQIDVQSLTYEGHKFLDTIRDPKIYRQAKEKVKSLSSVSLDIFSKVATQLLINQLGL